MRSETHALADVRAGRSTLPMTGESLAEGAIQVVYLLPLFVGYEG